ncbi:hypothetical protein AVEN_112362-1 [Araneus ventricosus]|uniref:Uncharacterized protein n=1 Tax=Araneus ventricosus TaxID=182803 RepID=A0A4Y2VND0_ARAVE|nr:hypothetical protein AVEN_112362-1 [Araneus ventricosus]
MVLRQYAVAYALLRQVAYWVRAFPGAGHFEVHLNNGHLSFPFMLTVSSSTWNPHPSIDGLLPFITELWGAVQNFHLPIARNVATFLQRCLLCRQVCSRERAFPSLSRYKVGTEQQKGR